MSLHLNLQNSSQLATSLAVIYGGAVLCLMLSNAAIWLKIVGVILCAFSAYCTVKKYALLSHPKATVACTMLTDGRWQLKNRQGEEQTVCLLGDSWQSRWMLILNFQQIQSKKRISVILCNDAVEEFLGRSLRVYLTTHVAQS